MDTARNLNLSSVNYFEWYYGRGILRPLWDAIAAYSWGGPPPPPVDICAQYIKALNSHQTNLIELLYTNDAVHISADKTIQGIDAIRGWYNVFFAKTLPNAVFKLTGVTGTGDSRHFTWEATSPSGHVHNGNDSLGLQNGRIVYHYSYFTIEK